ncbi:MAG: zinc ribbon domain-containing protein [Chloroflexi bacterium]|nr:MAG: zinc ribbon domain-containing protein [Chloroflexota bacterium]
MPIYEFVCGDCGYEFEKIQSFSASTPVCASCGADNVARQMGKPAIHFKGSGWYINDSKKGGGKTGNNSPASAVNGESGEGGAESAKSEAEAVPTAEKGGSAESKPAESSKEAAPSKESKSAPAKSTAEAA